MNNLISLLIESDPHWTLKGSRTAALLNLGSQINGSWRNEIGNEGGLRVKQLLVAFWSERGVISNILLESGSRVAPDSLYDVRQLRQVQLSNGCTLTFASEPDVAIRDSSGTLIATIEVKYGLDAAGALERYGAAMKSFEAATRENVRVANVYLASCITPEVQRRLLEDRLVSRKFNMTEVLQDAAIRENFLMYMHRIVDL